MKKTGLKIGTALSVMAALAFTSCESEDETSTPSAESGKGTANVGMTDAPLDAEAVSGFYMSVEGVGVSGVNAEDDTVVMFSAEQEVNVMAYQNGDVYDLTNIDLNAGSYTEMYLILDEDEPARIEYTNGTEETVTLEGGDNEYEIAGDFEIVAGAQTDLVLDIDLRKALERNYIKGEFYLKNNARLVNAALTGTIHGSIDNYEEIKAELESSGEDAMVVVYAYNESAFSMTGSTESNFQNAFNTAVVAEDGSFTLAFMNDADYELVVTSYTKSVEAETSALFEFDGFFNTGLMTDTSLDVLLEGIGVSASSSTDLSIVLDWN